MRVSASWVVKLACSYVARTTYILRVATSRADSQLWCVFECSTNRQYVNFRGTHACCVPPLVGAELHAVSVSSRQCSPLLIVAKTVFHQYGAVRWCSMNGSRIRLFALSRELQKCPEYSRWFSIWDEYVDLGVFRFAHSFFVATITNAAHA